MLLDEFLKSAPGTRADIDHDWFDALYCRMSRVSNGPVVEIVRVAATEPGQGAFRGLVEYIRSVDIGIMVEQPLGDRFQFWLLRNGFIEVSEGRWYDALGLLRYKGWAHAVQSRS